MLGVPATEWIGDFNDVPNGRTLFIAAGSTALNAPNNGLNDYRGILQTAESGSFKYQLYTEVQNRRTFMRGAYGDTWSAWQEISYDIPSFYKNYNDISSLASSVNTASWKYITLSTTGSEGKLFTPTNACVFVLLYDSGNRCGVYSYDKESGTIKTILAAPRVIVGAHADNSNYYMWVNGSDIYISTAASQSMIFNYLVLGE